MSHFRKWLKQLYKTEFILQFMILIVHPLPYYDSEYKIEMLDMLTTKTQYV